MIKVYKSFGDIHVDAQSDNYKVGLIWMNGKWNSSGSTATCDREYSDLLTKLWQFIDAKMSNPEKSEKSEEGEYSWDADTFFKLPQ